MSHSTNHEQPDQDESPLFRLHEHFREAGPQSRTGGGKNPLFSLEDATRYCGFPPQQKDLLTLAYYNHQLEGERRSPNTPEICYRQSSLDAWIHKGMDAKPRTEIDSRSSNPLYLLEEAARYTGRSRNEISTAFLQGRIPGEPIPPFGETAFRRSVLDAWTGKHPAAPLATVGEKAAAAEETIVEEQLRPPAQTKQKEEQPTMQAVQEREEESSPAMAQEHEDRSMEESTERKKEQPDDLLTAAEAVMYLQGLRYTQVTNVQRIFNARNVRRLPPVERKPGNKLHTYNRRADYLAWAAAGALISPAPAAEEPPQYFDVGGAARYLGISNQTVYNRVKAGTLERDPSVEDYRFTRVALTACRARYGAADGTAPPAPAAGAAPAPEKERVKLESEEKPDVPSPETPPLAPATNDLELLSIAPQPQEEHTMPSAPAAGAPSPTATTTTLPNPEETPSAPLLPEQAEPVPLIGEEKDAEEQQERGVRVPMGLLLALVMEHVGTLKRSAPQVDEPLILNLFEKLPTSGSVWPPRERVKWCKALDAVLDLVYKTEEEGSGSTS